MSISIPTIFWLKRVREQNWTRIKIWSELRRQFKVEQSSAHI